MGYEFTGIKKKIPMLLSLPHQFAPYAADRLNRQGIEKEDIRVTPFGVRVMTDDISAVMGCRVFDRLYLTVPIKRGGRLTGENAAETIADSMLGRILSTYIRGERPIPCRIRVEVPGSDKRGKAADGARDEERRLSGIFSEAVTKSLSGEIVVDPGSYECELFFPGRPDGSFGMYLWIAAMSDERFSYRRAIESTSMSAVRAATMMEMLHPYIIEDDSVLDPFCGTGTLLIERIRHLSCGNVFGTDISAKMIAGARENAAHASEHIHFIQRDFFDFTYDGYFDEIITELPDLYHRSDSEKKNFFDSFITKCLTLTTDGAILGILTGDGNFFAPIIKRQKHLEIAGVIPFGGKREVFILRRL